VDVAASTESPFALPGVDTVAVGVFAGGTLGSSELQGLLDRGEAQAKFRHLTHAHLEDRRVIVVGLGAREKFDPERARVAAAVVCQRAQELGSRGLGWELPPDAGPAIAEALVQGTLLRGYRFDRYRPEPTPPPPERLTICARLDLSDSIRRATVLTRAQNRARDLANTPANHLPPAALAEYVLGLADRVPTLSAQVLDEEQIRAAGMGAFAAVAQGSAQGARLIRLEYRPPDTGEPRLGLIGKGITFDSGGLSLKSAEHMHEMKFDMAGAAAVIEAIAALAELEAPGAVLGVIGAAENLPSGRAVKPGDIVTALDGTTIEINNTDAEGRLVLADCLTYARQAGCQRLLDIATLTGGVVIALGSVHAGLMGNHQAWTAEVATCAQDSGEAVWRLPLHPEYAEMMKGRYAQLTNRAERREAHALTAAEFLHHFAGQVPWAHLDIAGTAYDVPRAYFSGKGATGFGVRLLAELASRSA